VHRGGDGDFHEPPRTNSAGGGETLGDTVTIGDADTVTDGCAATIHGDNDHCGGHDDSYGAPDART